MIMLVNSAEMSTFEPSSAPGVIVDVIVAEEDNVYPMVPPGAAVDQLIRRPKPAVMQGYSGVQPSW